MRLPKRVRGLLGNVLVYLTLIAIIGVFMIPVYWIVSTSLKLPTDILTVPPKFVFEPTLANYRVVLLGEKNVAVTGGRLGGSTEFPRYLLNSLIVSLSSTGLALVLGAPAAYCLARFEFRGKKLLAYYMLSTRMIPGIAIVIPFYIMFSRLQLVDTYVALTSVLLTINLAFVVWMMKGFFQEIPVELEEAALVDGCTRLGAIRRIVLPLAISGLSATAIFCMILCWNEFLYAVILTTTNAKTATVAVATFMGYREIAWGSMMAAAVAVAGPVLIFTLLVQRNLVRGLLMGAVK